MTSSVLFTIFIPALVVMACFVKTPEASEIGDAGTKWGTLKSDTEGFLGEINTKIADVEDEVSNGAKTGDKLAVAINTAATNVKNTADAVEPNVKAAHKTEFDLMVVAQTEVITEWDAADTNLKDMETAIEKYKQAGLTRLNTKATKENITRLVDGTDITIDKAQQDLIEVLGKFHTEIQNEIQSLNEVIAEGERKVSAIEDSQQTNSKSLKTLQDEQAEKTRQDTMFNVLICLLVFTLIGCIVALILGVMFTLKKKKEKADHGDDHHDKSETKTVAKKPGKEKKTKAKPAAKGKKPAGKPSKTKK